MIKKQKNKNSLKLTKGMTLIEIIIVLIIVIILILIMIAFFRSQLLKSNDARRKADVNRIKIAVEEYEKDHNCYPLPALLSCQTGTGLQPYIDKIPCDPVTKASYYYDQENISCPSWFRIYADLENTTDPLASSTCGPSGSYNFSTGSTNAPACNLTQRESLYGCKSGLCVPILWDETRVGGGGPECDPNFQSPICYGQCGVPSTECRSPGH